MCTRPGSIPRMRAVSSRSMYGVWVHAKIRMRLADPLGVARFRLDVRVLDEAGRELALGHVRRRGDRRVDVALHHPPADKDVVGVRRVDRLARVRERFLDLGLRGLHRPADRDLVVADREHGVLLADQAQHRLAAKAHAPVGEHRLVLHVGEDAEAVHRHVARGDDVDQPRMRSAQRPEVAEREACPGVRRADGPQPERTRGRGVGSVALGPGDFREPVRLRRRELRPPAPPRAPRLLPHRPPRRAPPPRSCDSRCTGRARRQARRAPRARSGADCARGARWRPSTSPGCRSRIGPRRARGTRAGGGRAFRPRPGPRPSLPPGPPPAPARPGTRTPAGRREARCTHRSRRRCTRSSCRSARARPGGHRRGGSPRVRSRAAPRR